MSGSEEALGARRESTTRAKRGDGTTALDLHDRGAAVAIDGDGVVAEVRER